MLDEGNSMEVSETLMYMLRSVTKENKKPPVAVKSDKLRETPRYMLRSMTKQNKKPLVAVKQ